MAWLLLGTEGCHLCGDARQVLVSLAGYIRVDVFEQDIVEHSEWLEQFAQRIPVLLDEASGESLDWPFNAEDVMAWQQQLLAKKEPQ